MPTDLPPPKKKPLIPSPMDVWRNMQEDAQKQDDEIMRDRNYEPISPGEMAGWAYNYFNSNLGPGDIRDVFDDEPDTESK